MSELDDKQIIARQNRELIGACLLKEKLRALRQKKARVALKLRQGHALAVLLKVAGLSRSTFYYQLSAQQTGDRQAALKARIRALYAQHKGCYGYRRPAPGR